MNPPRLNTPLVTMLILVIGLLFYSLGHAGKSPAQDAEKSLDIERYPNEPLELVEIKVGEKSLKSGIKVKMRENTSKWGLDTVRFKEQDGWFKHLKVTVRNVSGRPIYGLRAGLDFKPPDQRILFRLPLTWTKELKRDPLQPGHEIDLEVDDRLLDRAMQRMVPYSADANKSSVSFSLNDAYFSEDLKWSRGHLLRRDPNNHFKWDVVDKADASGASRLEKPAGFTVISFRTASAPPQALETCQADRGGEYAFQCSDDYDYCVRIVELGNGTSGYLSGTPQFGDCEREGVSCLTQTTHSRLSYEDLPYRMIPAGMGGRRDKSPG